MAIMKKSVATIIDNVNALMDSNDEQLAMRYRIRSIMDGGQAGMRALLGTNIDNIDIDTMPAPNLLISGLDRLAQKISGVPDIRVDRVNDKDSERARKRAEKIERIVASYDEKQKLKNQLGQVSRWLPGYGYCSWVIKTTKDVDGNFFPYAELRDPYNTYPGHLGADQQPDEIAYVRRIPLYKLMQIYPEHARSLKNNPKKFTKEVESDKPVKKEVKKVSPMARVRRFFSKIVSEIDQEIDDFIINGYKTDFNVKKYSKTIKPIYGKMISQHYQSLLTELQSVVDREDIELVESYSYMKRSELRRFVKFIKEIVDIFGQVKNKRTKKKAIKRKKVAKEKTKPRKPKKQADIQLKTVPITDFM